LAWSESDAPQAAVQATDRARRFDGIKLADAAQRLDRDRVFVACATS